MKILLRLHVTQVNICSSSQHPAQAVDLVVPLLQFHLFLPDLPIQFLSHPASLLPLFLFFLELQQAFLDRLRLEDLVLLSFNVNLHPLFGCLLLQEILQRLHSVKVFVGHCPHVPLRLDEAVIDREVTATFELPPGERFGISAGFVLSQEELLVESSLSLVPVLVGVRLDVIGAHVAPEVVSVMLCLVLETSDADVFSLHGLVPDRLL